MGEHTALNGETLHDLRYFVIYSSFFVYRSAQRYNIHMSNKLKSLQSAYTKVATLVLTDPVYLPIFVRIEREIAILESDGDAISRARAVAARHKAVA